MSSETQNCWWTLAYLSDIELYYTTQTPSDSNEIIISGEESKHIIKVMRHVPGDVLYVTNGMGSIFKGTINNISREEVTIEKSEEFSYQKKYPNIIFCLPKLKSNDRFEFALEKCVELGITEFIIFHSSRSISKGEKTDRWNKILIAAMKQSLNSHLPIIHEFTSLTALLKDNTDKYVFDQNSYKLFKGTELINSNNYYLIFGPEGGLSAEELNLFNTENIFKLSENRLRSETAILKAASLLS